VDGIGGMEKDGGGAGGVEGGYDLLGYDSAFANAADDYPALAGEDQSDRFLECAIEHMFQGCYGSRLFPDDILCYSDDIGALIHVPIPSQRILSSQTYVNSNKIVPFAALSDEPLPVL